MEADRPLTETVFLKHVKETPTTLGTQHEFQAFEVNKSRPSRVGKIVFIRLATGAHHIHELKVLPQTLPLEPLEIRRMENLRKHLLKFVEKRVLGNVNALQKERKKYSKMVLLDAPEEEHEFWKKQGFSPERKAYTDREETSRLLKKL